MKNKLFLCLFFVLAPLFAFAEVRQAPTMESALEGAEKGTLVIFDLDNTVMMPPQTLGGEEWYDYFVEKRTEEFVSQGLNASEAKNKAVDQGLKEWSQFHKNAKVTPVEKQTPQLISDIQGKGVITMALTARPIDLADSTINQLKSIGIDFSQHSISNRTVSVPGENIAKFYKGALLVGPKNNKGTVLVKFLKMIKAKPVKIIFVDNKQHHVDNVEKALADLKIPYFGRRHGAADKKISAMNKQIVEVQHRYFFGDVLSDDEARKLIK